MTDGITRRIDAVSPMRGYRLAVTWRDGGSSVVDFSDDIKRGGIWSALRDPSKFSQARIADHGAVLEWPEPAGSDGSPRIDIDADGLHALGVEQRTDPWIERVFHSIFDRVKVAG